uniref:MHD domain-containing protein n=1 Tax=Lactuca sativa TaxID=4236 RepID=A0A9R1WZG7_LACSA|nr:hypothetical protein LSAT_V11C800427030 [Lactuca sativa]
MAFGTGSVVAHRAVDSIMGPRIIQHETIGVAIPDASVTNTSVSDSCGMHSKAFTNVGLNDRVLLEAQGRTTKGKAIYLGDIKFHQCVLLAHFENDRTISFVPPDGAFDLMTYRLST